MNDTTVCEKELNNDIEPKSPYGEKEQRHSTFNRKIHINYVVNTDLAKEITNMSLYHK